VRERRGEVQRLVREREEVLGEILLGREMLAVAERVEDLQSSLAVAEEAEWDDDESDGEDGGTERLTRLVHGFASLRNQVRRLGGREQPFMAKLDDRMLDIRKTLLIDLSTALKQAKSAGEEKKGHLIGILGLYSVLDEGAEVVKILKETKS
jgi:hypothetical protein